ncbi:MAG TPA: mandelate racemase/muconate lactonizing enzyme family protein [Candidatus Limnocylindrales bacterium]
MGTPTRVERIDVYGYDLTYVHGTYVMSGGRIIESLPSTVVRVTTADGVQGYGESCPLGTTYLPSFGGGARAAMAELGPAMLGVDAANLAAVNRAMDGALMGHGYAKSAIDVACWDVLGKVSGRPVAELLGGVLQTDMPLYVAVPLGPAESMVAFVEQQRAEGIRHFQLKVGDAPEKDAARVAAVIGSIGDDDALVADANGAWRRQDAIMAARLLDGYGRLRLEQPCPTFEECLSVRQACTLPMVLDECITDMAALVRGVEANAMDQINLKVGRVGGLTRARAMRDTAVELGLRLMIEDTWGGDLVSAAVSHLAAATPPESLFAVSFMNDWTQEHVAGYRPRSSGGRGPVPTGPGLGIEIDESMLGAPLMTFRA